MQVLFPLFLAALGGLSLPLIMHLVRRTPRGRQAFSSLMFLSPTPPRLTRRSRLDQILLLLLRLSVLALLVLAFARPYFREASLLSLGDLPRRRVAILVDTSASMRRGDLWQQMNAQVERELADLAPHDEVALYAFSDRLETVVGFAAPDKAESATRSVEVVREKLRGLEPTWAAGDLGAALTSLAGELESAGDAAQTAAEPQLILVSDMARGNRTAALQGFTWPPQVRLIVRQLTPAEPSNATLQFLPPDAATMDAGGAADDAATQARVRVANAANSTRDQFFLRWQQGEQPAQEAAEVAVYVPPGQSRIVRVARPASLLLADRLLLRGDGQDFDNTYFVVPPQPQDVTLAYLGADAVNDPEGLRFYFELAAGDDPLRNVTWQTLAADTPLASLKTAPQLTLVTQRVASAQAGELLALVEKGGTLLVVPRDLAAAASLPEFFPGLELGDEPAERKENDFGLLGELDFSHPLLLPFAAPRYNDFTRIRFWRHRPVRLAADNTAQVVARFDNGEPWLIERWHGRGRVLALTSGWQPEDSQLAVSSKFVTLVATLLELAAGSTQPPRGVVVNEGVPLPRERAATLVVVTPGGEKVAVAPDVSVFQATAQPGIYRAALGSGEWRCAVNVPPAESETAPLPVEQLEQLGVKLGASVSKAERLDRMRQAKATELENRQQVWRWLLVGCVIVIMVETWWAGRAAQVAARPGEASA